MEWYYMQIICLGIPAIIIIVLYWFFKANLTPSPTSTISEKITCIKNSIVNVYVYTKGSDRVVIDGGFSTKGLKKELMIMDIIPETISDVFITHSDPDHIGGLSLFNKAHVYFGVDSKVKNFDEYKLMSDNDIIMVGAIKIQAISTPGHRNGHTSYLIDDQYLFTGDLLRLKNDKVKPFFKLISSDFDQLLESIRIVAKIENVEMLLTAHSGYTTEFNKAIEAWKN